MPSAFFAALAMGATAAVDAIMAEGWTLLPMCPAPEKAAGVVPDTSRMSVLFQGTFVDPEAKAAEPNAYDVRHKNRPGIVAGNPMVLVSPFAITTALAATSDFGILQGDKLVRSNDGKTWGVARVFPMPGGTLKLSVNLIG